MSRGRYPSESTETTALTGKGNRGERACGVWERSGSTAATDSSGFCGFRLIGMNLVSQQRLFLTSKDPWDRAIRVAFTCNANRRYRSRMPTITIVPPRSATRQWSDQVRSAVDRCRAAPLHALHGEVYTIIHSSCGYP